MLILTDFEKTGLSRPIFDVSRRPNLQMNLIARVLLFYGISIRAQGTEVQSLSLI
jgi:hypothetical protein